MRACRQGICLWAVAMLMLALSGRCHAQTRTVHYYYTDPQGTPLVKTDAQGNVIARYDYTPYGNSVSSLGIPPNEPGYTGHVNDPETGLVYMQARYYQPTGRFLSPDPVTPTPGDIFDFNRYAYTNNNPINHTDPNGKCLEDACIGEGILLAEGVEYLVSAYEASEVAAGAAATTTTLSASQTVAACAANTVCTGLAVTTATAVTAKVAQEIKNTSTVQLTKEHTKNARPSSKGKHEKGNTRKKQDAGGEKGDKNRPQLPRQRPDKWKGPWPPKPAQ